MLITSPSEGGKCTEGDLVFSSEEGNELYTKVNDVDYLQGIVTSDNVAARIQLLSSTTHPGNSQSNHPGTIPEFSGRSSAKQVRTVVPSDSDEEGPDFV